jgi:predicted O-methyltransferase YrrM
MNFDNYKLNLNLAWRIGEEAFLKVLELIHQKLNVPNCIIEFGSGASSIRLALNFPQTKIVSIDADVNFYHRTQELAKEVIESPNLLELKYQALSFHQYGTGNILTYTQDNSLSDINIDCVIIDGPPFYTLRGREACLYQIYDQLRIGGLVILDDVNRESEKNILKNWLLVYPNSFNVEIIEVGHHIAILEKRHSIKPDWLNQNKQKDSIDINQKYSQLTRAFLGLKDADFMQLLKSLENHVSIPALENQESLDNFLEMMSIIRNVYLSVAKNIDFRDQFSYLSNLTDEEILQEQCKLFNSCLNLLNLN